MFALLVPILLSCLALAAHFFRGGQVILMLIVCAVPLLLVVRRPWSTRLVQVILIIGALEWIRTLLQIRAVRMDEAREWHRMACILGSVALFTLLSALVFLLPGVKRSFSRT